jgi:AcrR family transcriptional regulator
MSRTPSKAAHDQVLKAALHLISERGIEATSMDAIAAEAGVSKATVYKHWPTKDALLIEVIENLSEKFPEFDSDDPKADLRSFLRYLAQSRKREEMGRIWPRVISYAITNPEFAKALAHFSFAPRRRQIARILKRAAKRGELQGEIDSDLAMDMLIGPLMHRRFMDHRSIPVELADQVTDYFWKTFSPKR